MTVNPIDYTTIANGTIHLNGSKGSSSARKTEDKEEKKAKSTSNAESKYIDTDFSDNSDELLASMSQKSDELMSALKSLLKNGISSSAVSSADKVSSAGAAPVSGITGDIVNKLNSKFKGALTGKGAVIAGAAQKYGIEPELLAAIMALETGWGTSSAVNNQKNPGGLMDPASNWMSLQSFATIEQGIEAMAKNLKTGYLDKGLTSIAAIGNKYCPVGAANDPNGTNGGWIPSVTSIYNQLKT